MKCMSLRRLTIKKPCRRIIVKWIERLIVMLLLFTPSPSPSPSLPLSLAVSVPFFLFFLCASVGAVKSKYSDETRCCCYLLRKIHCLRRIKKRQQQRQRQDTHGMCVSACYATIVPVSDNKINIANECKHVALCACNGSLFVCNSHLCTIA